jgi:hypothetical protein
VRLVEFLDDELDCLVTASESCRRGWIRVDVVTDHGWMLLPEAWRRWASGGDDRAQEGAMRGSRWRRSRRRHRPWFWIPMYVSLAPGATCFEANKEYEHGGVSPQECIVPRSRCVLAQAAALVPQSSRR